MFHLSGCPFQLDHYTRLRSALEPQGTSFGIIQSLVEEFELDATAGRLCVAITLLLNFRLEV